MRLKTNTITEIERGACSFFASGKIAYANCRRILLYRRQQDTGNCSFGSDRIARGKKRTCAALDFKFCRGFTATTAVILLATGTLAFSLASLVSAALYADSVNQRELRIQARLNASACLETVTLMAYKDYFLNGPVTVPEFGCTGNVSNDYLGHISLNVKASLEGVSAYESGGVTMNGQ